MCRNCVKNDDFVENGYFQEKFYLETLGLLEKDLKVDFVVVVIVRKVAIMHEINILWKVSSWKG